MKTTSQPIDINPTHLETIHRILDEHVPDCEVRAFGSRAKWNASDYSDLDLAVVGDQHLEWHILSQLKTAFEESDLPFRVDVLDWHDISDKFREMIEADCIALVEANHRNDGNETTVGEFAPFSYGKALKKNKRNSAGSVPVYGSNGIVGWHDEAVTQGPTVVVGRKGTVGAVHYSPVPCWPIDTTFFVTGQDPELVRFQYYALKSLKLDRMNSDSAVPGLNREAAHARSIRIPLLTEQRSIANILGTLDDKIELNQRMNETLEAMVQTLFKSWFVDFTPVRAKMEGHWRPGESLPGLPAHLYDLFPDRLIPSELGDIPEGWGIEIFGDQVEIIKGRSYRRSELNRSETALVTLKSFKRGGGYRSDGLKPYTGNYRPEQVVKHGDIVLACTDVTQAAEVIGQPARIQYNNVYDTLVASLDAMILKPKDQLTNTYIYLLCGTHKFTSQAVSHTTGTTVLHLARIAVSCLPFVLPHRQVIGEFTKVTEKVFNAIDNISLQLSLLYRLQDILIPELTSR